MNALELRQEFSLAVCSQNHGEFTDKEECFFLRI
jgi:hypothetical protein